MKKLKRNLTLIFFAGLLLFILSGCATKSEQKEASHGITVVSSLDFYGETAKAILGNKGTVTSIIRSDSVDAEDYEPDISDAKLVSNADFIIANGLGYDDWMTRLEQANDKSVAQKITVGSMIMKRQNGQNPHVWYAPSLMPKLAKELTEKFSKQDPNNRSYYEKRLKKYLSELMPLQNQLKRIKQNRLQTSVAVSEPVFNDSLAAMGYRVSDTHFSEAIEEGSDPSPKDIRQLENQIKNHKIAFFVENTQNSSSEVKNIAKLAKQVGIPVVKVTETMPARKSYVEWMESQYKQVENSQEVKRGE